MRFRMAMLWSAWPVRMRLSSSPKATSMTQWWAFSMLQCRRTVCSWSRALDGRLEMKKRPGGPGPQGRTAGPAAERSRLRLGGLVYGLGEARCARRDHRRRPRPGPALDASGLDRQPCAVHMQRTVGRHIRGLDEDTLTHLDRVLLPILQRLARERPPEAGPVRLGLWQAVAQGRVRLHPEVRKRLWHLVTRLHDLVRSQHPPRSPPPPTGWRAGWAASSPGPASRGG